MPQKMLFTRYKNGPAAKEAGSSAVSAISAGQIYSDKVHSLTSPIEADKGIYTPQMASEDFVSLPQPLDDWYADPEPVARNLLDRPIVQASALDQFAKANQTPSAEGFYSQQELEEAPLRQTSIPYNRTPLGHAGPRSRRKAKLRGSALAGVSKATGGVGGLGAVDASPWQIAYGVASLAGTGLGAYHGYKRNDSVGWAIGWALLGGLFPIIVLPVAFAQGFAEPER